MFEAKVISLLIGAVLLIGGAFLRLRRSDTLAEQRFAIAARAAGVGVFDWDIGADSLYWSAEQFSLFECDQGSFEGRFADWERCLHPDDREDFRSKLQAALVSDNDRCAFEYRVLTPIGSIRHIQADAHIIRDRTRRAVRLIGIHSDVTKQRQNEAELNRARIQAEAGVRAKSEFLANISHEIRTPLNAIITMSELILESRNPESDGEHLGVIAASARHLSDMMSDVLDFSKIDAHKIELSNISVDVNNFFSEIGRVLRFRATQKRITFSVAVDLSPGARLRFDDVRVRQVVVNLLLNAIKFTPPGGVVRLIVGYKDGKLAISVADTGPGIPIEKQQTIFEPFCQADNSTTRNFGGTGLGLSIAKRLAELLGGRLTLQSSIGSGATFTFEIPAETIHMPVQEVLAEMGTHCDKPSPAQLKVLVAEDNVTNQKVVRALLSRIGIDPILVENGEEAVRQVAVGNEFDLILMDCQMPVMSGYDAAQEIRLHESDLGRRTPILAMTASALEGDRERCIAAGMDDYISKPIHARDFEEKLCYWGENVRMRCDSLCPKNS